MFKYIQIGHVLTGVFQLMMMHLKYKRRFLEAQILGSMNIFTYLLPSLFIQFYLKVWLFANPRDKVTEVRKWFILEELAFLN